MEEVSTQDKQNYLRENILEKGYDATQFINFLKYKKGEEGEDVSNWSMPELQNVVNEFISLSYTNSLPAEIFLTDQQNNQINSQINTQTDNQGNMQVNQNSQINQINDQNNQNQAQNQIKNQNQNNENLQGLKEEDFGIIIPDIIECRKSETTELCKYHHLEITVNDPKKVDKGFFSKTYIDFAITTNPIKLSVRRQHSEFVWLRERLSVIFNTNILPRLPKKGKVKEDPHIQKRMRNLEKFLNFLVKDPLLKSSQILYDFLSIDNEEEYNKRKKIYNKMRTPNDFKEIKSIDGKTKIKISENKENNIENIRDLAAFNETALKKFNQNFKELRLDMNTIINRILSFSPLFDKLIKISTNYLEDNAIIESYKQMQNLFNSWGDILKKQNSFFLTDVKEYLKFLSGNYHHLRDLVQEVENQKTNYYKLSKNLMSKKMDLFRKGDTSNWQLDINDRNNLNSFSKDRVASYKKICFKETNNVIKYKEKYGYYLNRLISEYVRMKNINAYENKEKVKQFSKKEGQIASEYFKKMSEILIIMDRCNLNINPDDAIFKKLNYGNEDNNIIQQKQDEQKKEDNNIGDINTGNYEENKDENIINDNKEQNEEKEENNQNVINDKEDQENSNL